MSQVVELSVPHFQKLFKAETGIAPIAYLRDLRLKGARTFRNKFLSSEANWF
ncbi:MAG: hypothetical protein M3367_00730 [Acidobacteriota bacterium]|nr:hypothetical protein [Acidobacteriota bacterium]